MQLESTTFVLELIGEVAETETASKVAIKTKTKNFAHPAKVATDTWRAGERAGRQAPAGTKRLGRDRGSTGERLFRAAPSASPSPGPSIPEASV